MCLNSGSSSLKFHLFAFDTLKALAWGTLDHGSTLSAKLSSCTPNGAPNTTTLEEKDLDGAKGPAVQCTSMYPLDVTSDLKHRRQLISSFAASWTPSPPGASPIECNSTPSEWCATASCTAASNTYNPRGLTKRCSTAWSTSVTWLRCTIPRVSRRSEARLRCCPGGARGSI